MRRRNTFILMAAVALLVLTPGVVLAIEVPPEIQELPVNKIEGTDGNNVLFDERGSRAVDAISGKAGDDVLVGRRGWDGISGGDGRDVLYGGKACDGLFGNGGRDVMYGGPGNDSIFAQDGEQDVILCGSGSRDEYKADSVDYVATDCELEYEEAGYTLLWWKRLFG